MLAFRREHRHLWYPNTPHAQSLRRSKRQDLKEDLRLQTFLLPITMDTLSEEALLCCLSFLHAKELYHLSCCSTSYKRIIFYASATEEIWKKLCWWKIDPITRNYRDEFRRRTQHDMAVYQFMEENAASFERRRLAAEQQGNMRPWVQIRNRMAASFDPALSLEAMKYRQERNDPLGKSGFRILYEIYLLQQFRSSLARDLPQHVSMELCMISISQLLLSESDNVTDMCTISTQIRTELDQLAEILRIRLPIECNDEEAALELTKMLSELGYRGNTESYYHVGNSSIRHVLRNKRGNPISLTILCHLVLNRLDIQTNIIGGMPGHVVLGLAGGQRFVDAFQVGHRQERVLLGLDDLRTLVLVFLMEWDDDFLRPSSPQALLNRILNNIRNGFRNRQGYEFCLDYLLAEIRPVHMNMARR